MKVLFLLASLSILILCHAAPGSAVEIHDRYDRPDAADLGPTWKETLPELEIFGEEGRNADGGDRPKAAVFNQAVGPDQDASVSCKLAAPENACGVMARYLNEGNFYRARIDVGRIILKGEGRYKGTARVTSETPDPLSANNEASASAVAFTRAPSKIGADLILGFLADPDLAAPGEVLSYTIVILNVGPDAAAGITVTTTLQEELTLIGAPDSCRGSQQVVCHLGALKAGENVLIRLKATTQSSGEIIATASVGSATADPDLSSNSAAVGTTVDPRLLDPEDEETEGGVNTRPPTNVIVFPGGSQSNGVPPPETGSVEGEQHGGCALLLGSNFDPILPALLSGAALHLFFRRLKRNRGRDSNGDPNEKPIS